MTPFEVVFPRFSVPGAGAISELYSQLRRFERLSPARQRSLQNRQLAALVQHARQHSPYWRDRIDAGRPVLDALPVLTRGDVQENFPLLRAHGAEMDESLLEVATSSGSTGIPVRIERFLPIYEPLYHASTLTEHHWHKRDQTKRLGIVRSDITTRNARHWGAPYVWFGPTGPSFQFASAGASLDKILQVVMRGRPDYLGVAAPLAVNLAREVPVSQSGAIRIEQILTFGGPVTSDDRKTINAAFGSTVVSRYSCEETGYIAIQCPQRDHYHVLSGTVLVEIVDEQGRACPVGEPGRVLVTSLHSYGMPLIRYEVGDIAEWGPPCDCGITLPVIRRILGRSWRIIRRPDGKRVMARIVSSDLKGIEGLLEWRFVLFADNVIGAFIRSSRRLSKADEAVLRRAVHENLGHSYEVIVHQVDKIDWMHEWKREDFAVVDRKYRCC